MIGKIVVIGIGPGSPEQLTYQAQHAIDEATDFIGYTPYLDRVKSNKNAQRHGSDNRCEIERAHLAIELAQKGSIVAIISGGDPGIFGMASALFEVVQQLSPQIREKLDITIIPGVSAVLACAARVGAPLGGDFCVLSLSDNLKPWDVILKRLEYAAKAGFVIALYNPRSKARPYQLGHALELLGSILEPHTPVAFIKAAGRSSEECQLMELHQADPAWVDMRTLVIIGNQYSHFIATPSQKRKWLYTSRRIDD